MTTAVSAPSTGAACNAQAGALAACQPAQLLLNADQPNLLTAASLVHDGGIVFAKGYPAPRIENPNLVPIFTEKAGQALDADVALKLITLTNGQKTGNLPEPGLRDLAIQRAQGFRLFALQGLSGDSSGAGTGAASPTAEAQYALANVAAETNVPFFVRRPSVDQNFKLLDLPLSVDLRSQMPPVRDQGSRNTGVAFATITMLDYLALHDPNLTIKQASPEFLNWRYQVEIKSKLPDAHDQVWNGLATSQTLFFSLLHIDGNPTPSAGAPYVPRLRGVLGEDSCPYRPGLAALPPDVNILQAARAHLGDELTQRVLDHQPLSSQSAYFYRLKTDAGTYEAALAGGQPIQVTLPVYGPDWAAPDAGNHYRLAEMSLEKANDVSHLAYQAVVIVGYEKDAAAPGGGWFLARNSWGTGWGEGGHVRVSYRSVMQFGYAAHIAVAYAKPFAAVYDVFPPPDGPLQDPGATRPLPPISDTEAWGAYTDLTAAKEGDDIKNVPAPPIPVNNLGLPVARGNEGDSYADDKNHPGGYQGPGSHGAEQPLSTAPGLETSVSHAAPATGASAAPVATAKPAATSVPASVAPTTAPTAAASPLATAAAATAAPSATQAPTSTGTAAPATTAPATSSTATAAPFTGTPP